MPRVHKKKARNDIYRNGAKVEDSKTKSGFRMDRSKPADEHDTVLIPKGSTYYMWTFRFGGTHRSLTYPMSSQLTQSEFLQRVYGVHENMPQFADKSDLEAWLEETISELEELRDEQEEKRDNMPENLQDAPTGELLQERYDAVDNWIGELEMLKDRCEDEDGDEELEDLVGEIPDYEG